MESMPDAAGVESRSREWEWAICNLAVSCFLCAGDVCVSPWPWRVRCGGRAPIAGGRRRAMEGVAVVASSRPPGSSEGGRGRGGRLGACKDASSAVLAALFRPPSSSVVLPPGKTVCVGSARAEGKGRGPWKRKSDGGNGTGRLRWILRLQIGQAPNTDQGFPPRPKRQPQHPSCVPGNSLSPSVLALSIGQSPRPAASFPDSLPSNTLTR